MSTNDLRCRDQTEHVVCVTFHNNEVAAKRNRHQLERLLQSAFCV